MKVPNKNLTTYQNALKILSHKLRAQKITYKDLADQIGLSESGVKKVFASKDGSFERLLDICKVAGVSLYEILDDNRTLDVRYSLDQQKEFSKDRILFEVYWLLVFERCTSEEVQARMKLSSSAYFKKLRLLDKLGLIKLLSESRLGLPSVKAVTWSQEDEFSRRMYRDWSWQFFKDVVQSEKMRSTANSKTAASDEVHLLRYLPMKTETFKEFLVAIEKVEQDFLKRSVFELRTQKEKTRPVRWLSLIDRRSFVRTAAAGISDNL